MYACNDDTLLVPGEHKKPPLLEDDVSIFPFSVFFLIFESGSRFMAALAILFSAQEEGEERERGARISFLEQWLGRDGHHSRGVFSLSLFLSLAAYHLTFLPSPPPFLPPKMKFFSFFFPPVLLPRRKEKMNR
jgi:hypothetical protein